MGSGILWNPTNNVTMDTLVYHRQLKDTLDMSIITYYTHEQFYAGINELVRYGLIFRADHDELSITLTGGY